MGLLHVLTPNIKPQKKVGKVLVVHQIVFENGFQPETNSVKHHDPTLFKVFLQCPHLWNCPITQLGSSSCHNTL